MKEKTNKGFRRFLIHSFFVALLSILVAGIGVRAQMDSTKPKEVYKVAIFAPLYLDSAFDDSHEYRYAKNVFPKFINSGLEFYEGAQLALDSLAAEGVSLDVYVYDTRSTTESLEQQLKRPELNGLDLIIAHCSSNEIRSFAEAGLERHIPVVNSNMPNDGGISANPYFVVINPTLRTLCEGMYKYIQKFYANSPIVVFRKKGPIEDQVKTYFQEFGKNSSGAPLRIKYVDLPEGFTPSLLRAHLDTSRKTLCVVGSLDVGFGKQVSQHLASLNKDYPSMVMGMPTWDGERDFMKPEMKGLEIIYSTPFYQNKSDKLGAAITNQFNNTMYARPTDMVFRGYEITWRFVKLLLQYGSDISSNLGNKQYKVFTDYDIQPVLNKQNMSLDYFENKRLYFLKWQDGVFKSLIPM